MSKRIVVIGNGMVGHRLCDRLSREQNDAVSIVVFGEEPRAAYDRVHLTEYFNSGSADTLMLAGPDFYTERGMTLRTNTKVVAIDRVQKHVIASDGTETPYDVLVLATGSSPFVPPMAGIDAKGVFVYRTIEDLDAIRTYAQGRTTAAVLGGGLLGLEAARAVQALGLTSHVVEMAPRLMPRQLDIAGSRQLERIIRAMGIGIHLGKAPKELVVDDAIRGLVFADGTALDFDMLVVSAGIKPRDELARHSGLTVGERGGVVVDDALRTSDPSIFALGEVALHRGMIYGLVAPGYEMADALARTILGEETHFVGADLSTKLKLMGTDVASFGDPFAESEEVLTVAYQDLVKGVYKKVLFHGETRRIIGGVLVGDTSEYGILVHHAKTGEPLTVDPDALILGARGGGAVKIETPDSASICSCNNVSKGAIKEAIRAGSLSVISDVKKATCAGTGCGGCIPEVTNILDAELRARGETVRRVLCEHFDYTRRELFDIVRVSGYRTFGALLEGHGKGHGCEICKPTVASILASVHNEMILRHASLQDTNDRYLANIQRQGTYSVVPRIPGGEITPDKLIAIGVVAKKYGLYTKITGGQRIDLFGARLDDLPAIWEELVNEGFESGHAYGKALRTVKSCVGSTWCRYGVQDSVGFAIRVEERYKGIRAPHKMKSAVSGCVRECAEARGKDFGLIATEKGYNLYVGGNGGAKPRHADLLASDLDEATALKLIDRFMMYYIETGDRLQRTSAWVDALEGGIDRLKQIIIDDALGICAALEQKMDALVASYACEWTAVVRDPEQRARFKHFANDAEGDPNVQFVVERAQIHPAEWNTRTAGKPNRRMLPVIEDDGTTFVKAMAVETLPEEGGMAFRYGQNQIAVYRYAATGKIYATDNRCPHTGDQVLARGLLGDEGGVPKVACPHHKKTFSLETGMGLSDENFEIATFPTRVEDGFVYVRLPPAHVLAAACPSSDSCSAQAAE